MEMADYLGPEIFTESMVNPWWRQAQGQLGILHDFAQERLLESVTPQATGMQKRGLPVMHIVAISVLITVAGVLFLYMGDDKTQLQSTSKPTLAVAPSPASSSLNLTSTATPVEPLLQTLPGPANTQNIAVAEPAVTAQESIAPAEESTNQPVTEPQPANVEVDAVPKIVESSPVIAYPSAQEKPQPVSKPKPQDPLERPLGTSKNLQERTILGWPGSHYTIQLLGVSSEKAARDYVAGQANKKELLVFKSKRQGKDWFVVITGHYPSAVQARQAIAGLPTVQRDAGPWPREIKVIQQEIKAAF
jgi:DamX protein